MLNPTGVKADKMAATGIGAECFEVMPAVGDRSLDVQNGAGVAKLVHEGRRI